MNGLHIPGTPLVVDYWRRRNVPPRALYFLTHLHADHTSGLSAEWPYPIHCTPVTAHLLHRKFKIRPELIVELHVGESRLLHVECPRERVSVAVTVMDANHCPGSAMFLFEGYFGRILYTGDFRYSPEMAALSELSQHSAVDVLYLDNTYCHPSCQFPSRAKATEMIVRLIRENSDCTTLLGLHTLGKEDLLVAIAMQLGMWVGVSQERYEMLRCLEADNVFTTDMDSCFVRVLPFHIVLRTMLSDTTEEPMLRILPTCIFTGENAPPSPSHPSIKVVPYSDHSSYNELMKFVGVVRPRSIRPIVRSFSGDKTKITSLRCNMSVFNHLLDPTPVTSFRIPEGIAQLFSVQHHDPKPHPFTPPPTTMRSLTPNRRGRRKAAAGVCYLSPGKEKAGSGGCGEYDDFYCTDVEVIGGDREESGVEIVGERVEMVRERGAEIVGVEMVREREESSAEKVEMVREREEIAGEKVEMVRESSAEIVGVEMVREREESIAEKVEMVRERKEIAGEKVEMVREREEIANLIKPVSLTTKSTLHVPLEPRPNSHTPKPVLRPEIQVLSKSCHSSYVRSSSFYGTVPRKYMTYKRSHSVNGDTVHPLRHSDGEGKRQLPLSVTRPMLFTRLEREWGVVMDGVGGEGGGASSGTRKQSTKCKGKCVIRQHTMMNENTTPEQRTKNTSLEEMAKKGKGKKVAAATEKVSSCEGVRRGKRVGEVGDKGGGEKRSRRAKDPNVKSQDPFCPRCNPVDMIIDYLLGIRSDVELHSICPSCKPIPLEKKMNKLLGIC